MSAPKRLREYLVPFLQFCEVEKGLADNTQRNYRNYLRVFFAWLTKHTHEGLTPQELSAEHIWDYRLYLAQKHHTRTGHYLTKRSQNFYLIALRAFLEFLAERDIETLASSKVKLAKHKPDETISFLDPREIEAMLALPDVSKPEGPRDRAIMETFFSSGMRISELVSLDVAQLSPLRRRATEPMRSPSSARANDRARSSSLPARRIGFASTWRGAKMTTRRHSSTHGERAKRAGGSSPATSST
jgi:site-specific recombinase XerD